MSQTVKRRQRNRTRKDQVLSVQRSDSSAHRHPPVLSTRSPVTTDEFALPRGRKAPNARPSSRPDRSEMVRPIQSTTLVPGQWLTSKPSIHSALKEFFEPLRTNDSRADFFAVYRKESGEFDRDYAKKYDEDLNTSLIFVSRLISALPTNC